jgi:hypothetical protein
MDREVIHAGAGRPAGAGVDGDLAGRPGVPREQERVAAPGAHWVDPEPQLGRDAIGRAGLGVRTPVFGSAQPARRASGALRRVAYGIPEHRASRWALLLVADRLDVLEHRLGRGLWLVPVAGALAVGYLAVARALDRR